MRILHTSDWHLGRSLENINRIAEQREFVDQLCGIAKEERVDLVLIAGDVYDNYNPSAAAEELFYYALDRLNNGGEGRWWLSPETMTTPSGCVLPIPGVQKRYNTLGYPASRAAVDSGTGAGWWWRIPAPVAGGRSLRCGQSAVILTLPYPSEARLEQL